MRFFVVSLSLVTAATLCAAGDFAASCYNYYLDNAEFFATCGTENDSNQFTSINLNQCVTNNGGSLQCVGSNGNYASTCDGCYLSGTNLDCVCGNGVGGYDSTSVNLNNCLGNSNGVLVC